MTTRSLTYDEKKAAEAAFRGLPLNPGWSAAARAIYEGIKAASEGKMILAGQEQPLAMTEDHALSPEKAEEKPEVSAQVQSGSFEGDAPPTETQHVSLTNMTRDEAVKAGHLIDVSVMAREIGLQVPVGFTRPLWDMGITVEHQIPEDQQDGRVRDVLMALRLFLERTMVKSPMMEFPALLSFPPEPVPQVCSLCVLAHQDADAPYSLTLVLPREVSVVKFLPTN